VKFPALKGGGSSENRLVRLKTQLLSSK
jgi:hypothetical protein